MPSTTASQNCEQGAHFSASTSYRPDAPFIQFIVINLKTGYCKFIVAFCMCLLCVVFVCVHMCVEVRDWNSPVSQLVSVSCVKAVSDWAWHLLITVWPASLPQLVSHMAAGNPDSVLTLLQQRLVSELSPQPPPIHAFRLGSSSATALRWCFNQSI